MTFLTVYFQIYWGIQPAILAVVPPKIFYSILSRAPSASVQVSSNLFPKPDILIRHRCSLHPVTYIVQTLIHIGQQARLARILNRTEKFLPRSFNWHLHTPPPRAIVLWLGMACSVILGLCSTSVFWTHTNPCVLSVIYVFSHLVSRRIKRFETFILFI